MSNPLFDRFNGINTAQSNVSQLTNMLEQFNQFKSTFKGDPKQTVQSLLDSGQMSQEQFQQLSALAQQFQKMVR